MKNIERVKVSIIIVESPAEFHIQLSPYNNVAHIQHMDGNCAAKMNTRREYLSWIRDRAVWKCHLGFLAPTNNMSWSLTAIDTFKQYTDKRFIELAVTVPRSIAPSSKSTGVILWGLYERNPEEVEALEADRYAWLNINLEMVFQGVAKPTVPIDQFNHDFLLSTNVQNEMSEQMKHQTNVECQLSAEDVKGKRINRKKNRKPSKWLPAEISRSKDFKATPVHIDDDLTIYVQEWEHRNCAEHISNELTKWHWDRKRIPIRFWYEGDICVAKLEDGLYYRAEIVKILKRRKCWIHLIDFGSTELIAFDRLSAHTMFVDVPIQVRKCRLFNVTFASDEQRMEAVKFAKDLILGESCSFYIHDNFDPVDFESIPCNLCPRNAQIDLTTQLMSRKLAQYAQFLNHSNETGQVDMERRKRRDKRLLKDSSELKTFDDFKLFYENNKTDVPDYKQIADDKRTYEGFERPSKRCPLDENTSSNQSLLDDTGNEEPHPMVDRITNHFTMLRLNEPTFYCRVLYIIDPVTVLIVPLNTQLPTIDVANTHQKYFPLQVYSPCIAFLDHEWHRGIVWEKISTNKHLILFVDTMEIAEVHRKFIRKCPPELLGSQLQFAKVHLSKIKLNERFRALDACDQLSKVILNRNLYAKFVGVRNDGVPDIKLYTSHDSKHMIYDDLVRCGFYKKLK